MGDNDPRIVDRTERNKATSFRDNASGPPVEQEAVTGRPNDEAPANTTFADRRAKARKGSKAVKDGAAENKAVTPKATTAKRS